MTNAIEALAKAQRGTDRSDGVQNVLLRGASEGEGMSDTCEYY